MSLQLAAQHLSSQGRGKDSTLVHMSPREVKGLNDLAMAHGGQLSINPSTGLPEAGFLESILPMVAGAGLMMIPGMQPMGAAAITGGLSFAMTGSLQKGLMAGLGAYGGAGLGEGLMASGVDAAAATDTASQAAQTQIAENAANTKFYDPSGALDPAMKSQYVDAQLAAQNQAMAARQALQPTSFMDKIQMMGKGVGSLGGEGGISNLYKNLGGSPMSLLKTVGSAAAPAIGEMMTPKKEEETKADADMGQRYGFSMNPTGGQTRSLGGGQTRSLGGGQPQQVQPGQDPLANTPSPTTTPFPHPDIYGREQRYFSPSYTKFTPEQAKATYGYADGGITGQGDLQLNIPLNLGGGSGGGSYGGGGNSGGTYPFQNNGGFAGNNNAPQVTSNPSLVADQAQRMQPYQATPTQGLGAPQGNFFSGVKAEPQDKSNLFEFQQNANPMQQGTSQIAGLGSVMRMAVGGIAAEDRPTETPAVKMFQQMQAQRAAQAQAPQVDVNAQYANYLKQTVGSPPQMPTAPTSPAPTTTNLASSGYAYDPVKQQYGQIQGSLEDEEEKNKSFLGNVAGDFGVGSGSVGNRPMNLAVGGSISHLGDYSDGGRLLRGPGDGVSDSIPAMIGKRQPARLADGEFVVPARIVSELGNGSTEAGARKLYAMMDRIQKARGKTVGKGKVAKNSRSEKYLPA